jgi:hypothetical protein
VIRPGARLLERVGVDLVQHEALLTAFLLLDLRSQHYEKATGAKPREMMSPLFWVAGQCLLAGAGIAALLFVRVDAFTFALGALIVSMLICGSAVIVEFNELVLAPIDLEVLGHRPLSGTTYASARLINLLAYVLLITTALNIFPAILGAWLHDSNWRFIPAYAAAALIANLLVVGVVIVAFVSLSSRGPWEPVRDTLAWVQICIVVIFGYGIQMAFRDSRYTIETFALNLPDWVRQTPPGWLALVSESFAAGEPRLDLLFASVVLCGGVWVLATRSLADAWTRLRPERERRDAVISVSTRPGMLASAFAHAITRPGAERVSFWLCSTMLRRDAELRMRNLPLAGSVFGLMAVGAFTGQLPDPFVSRGSSVMLSIACIILPAMSIPTLLHNFQFSAHHASAWLLDVAPGTARGSARGAMSEGIRLAVMWRLLLPVFLLMFAAFWWLWGDPIHALLHAAAGWLLADVTSRLTLSSVITAPPLSRSLARGESLGRIGMISAVVSGAVAGAGLLYALACESAWTVAAVVATTLAGSLAFSRLKGEVA